MPERQKYPIEKGIPRPSQIHEKRVKYPCRDMEVGDSFFVPDRTTRQVGNVIRYYNKFGKFSVRAVDGGVRVWRIK